MTASSVARASSEPDIHPPGWALVGALLAGVLAFNGLLSFAVEALYLPSYLGSTPFPISAAFAAVGNVLLVLAMSTVAARPAAVALPLIAWLVGFVICLFSGPGGDVILTDSWTTPLFLACGVVPAGLLLFWRTFVLPARVATRKA